VAGFGVDGGPGRGLIVEARAMKKLCWKLETPVMRISDMQVVFCIHEIEAGSPVLRFSKEYTRVFAGLRGKALRLR
jgi:hypothetical protein